MTFLLKETSKRPEYEPFPKISGSRSHLIVSAACISLRVDHPRTQMISISSQPSLKIRNEEFEYPQSVA